MDWLQSNYNWPHTEQQQVDLYNKLALQIDLQAGPS